MNHLQKIVGLTVFCFYSCTQSTTNESTEKWKAEIIETERRFAEMAQNEGIPKAFLSFAADEAVLLRQNKIITVKDQFGDAVRNENVTLSWTPDFVDVSTSGDLGYTYGGYVFTSVDSLGNKSESTGVFHTVWKRQKDGTWKFVWD